MARIPGIGLGVAAGLLVLIAFFSSWFTIDEGERGVLLTNGAVSGVVDPGLHFKLPIFQTVAKISLRQQVVYWTCTTSCGSDERPVMQAYSRDQQPADLRVTVNFHVPASEVVDVYTNYGSVEALADRVIARKAPQEIKVVFGQVDAVSVIQNRADFNAKAAAALGTAADGPVIIDSVQIENIDFSDAYEAAVEARMMAQVEVQKRQQQLAQEKINAEIAVTQAQGRADSVKAEADAEAYQTRVNGEAEAAAIEARGRAIANNPLLIELTRAERWDGKLPVTMLPGSTVPFLEVGPKQ
jgi:regulator of protease activity HflC (stomatin/prohibitin superfamily)